MLCTLWDATYDQPPQTSLQSALAGTLVSSLHRLKDVDNTGGLFQMVPQERSLKLTCTDGGFFVFGDLSVKLEGDFRLRFNLFEMVKSVYSLRHLVFRNLTDLTGLKWSTSNQSPLIVSEVCNYSSYMVEILTPRQSSPQRISLVWMSQLFSHDRLEIKVSDLESEKSLDRYREGSF